MSSAITRSCRAVALTGVAGLLSLTAACGGDESAAAGSGTGDSGVTLDEHGGSPFTEVTVQVTGAVTVTGGTTALPATNHGVDYTSCDQYGKGEPDDDGKRYFVLPQDLKDSIGGKQVFVGVMIEDYRGAGTYDKGTLTDAGSPPGIIFAGTLYFQQSGSRSTVTTDGKGGGKWTFTGLSVQKPSRTPGGGEVDGSVTWACRNG